MITPSETYKPHLNARPVPPDLRKMQRTHRRIGFHLGTLLMDEWLPF
jgi:hypothetical protein